MKRGLLFIMILSIMLSCNRQSPEPAVIKHLGAVVRGDTSRPVIALVFTGGDFADGGDFIRNTLLEKTVRAGFFFTGDFYRNKNYSQLIHNLISDGHYLGPHSDRHLLYCSWEKRDSTIITQDSFYTDLMNNYSIMKTFGLNKKSSPVFLPPFEWYNQEITDWCASAGVTLINMTHGTLSHADYTIPAMKNYRPSDTIYQSILDYEEKSTNGLNGFILLIHIGTHPDRRDKFYNRLGELIQTLRAR